ncbi:MAG: dinitrogenase iron-molybdenum cofactor biosynthesis protein [Actinobacteria bacterium]|nr:dinitrogenase iron-molybdenum cofactor biosynthesis protein [Actinomycetota bacterium]
MKIAVTSRGPNASDPFDQRFGRAPYFLVYDTASDSWSAFDNTENKEAQSGAGIGAATKVAETGATTVITGHVGPKAERALQAAGIKIVLSTAQTVEEALKQHIEKK